jgi:thioredoxin 1
MIIRDGILVYDRPGALPEKALNDLIARVRTLDMDQIRCSAVQNADARS